MRAELEPALEPPSTPLSPADRGDLPGPFGLTPAPVGTPGSTPTPGKRTPASETRGTGEHSVDIVALLVPETPWTQLPNPCHPSLVQH